MKKLFLSIALLAAIPGLQAEHCSPCSASKAKKHTVKKACATCDKKVCKQCKSHGKKKCACGNPSTCKCCKRGPVRTTLKATGEVVEDAGEVVATPFKALFGKKGDDHKKKHSHKTIHNKHKRAHKHDNETYINELEEDVYEETNDNF